MHTYMLIPLQVPDAAWQVSPPIFFLPAKHTRDTEKQLEATRAGIKGKIAALKHQLPQAECKITF